MNANETAVKEAGRAPARPESARPKSRADSHDRRARTSKAPAAEPAPVKHAETDRVDIEILNKHTGAQPKPETSKQPPPEGYPYIVELHDEHTSLVEEIEQETFGASWRHENTIYDYEVTKDKDLVFKVLDRADRSRVLRQRPTEGQLSFKVAYRKFLRMIGL